MASKVCALFSLKYSKEKMIHYFQQNCCFIKSVITYFAVHIIFDYNGYLDQSRASQGHFKVKTPISLVYSRESAICIYLESDIIAKTVLLHQLRYRQLYFNILSNIDIFNIYKDKVVTQMISSMPILGKLFIKKSQNFV